MLDLAPAEAADELSARRRVGARSSSIWPSSAAAPASRARRFPALLRALRRQLSDTASAHLHRGATSQDVIDTAMMLVARRALDRVLVDFGAAADACASLVERHRDAIVPGRTLLQQALPVTFGLKAAGWLPASTARCADLARGSRPRARASSSVARSGRWPAWAIVASRWRPSSRAARAADARRSRGTRSGSGPRGSPARSGPRSG